MGKTSPPSEGLGEASLLAWGGFFSLPFVTPLRVTRYIFIPHTLIKGIKIVEFKGKKSIIKQRIIKCRFLR